MTFFSTHHLKKPRDIVKNMKCRFDEHNTPLQKKILYLYQNSSTDELIQDKIYIFLKFKENFKYIFSKKFSC